MTAIQCAILTVGLVAADQLIKLWAFTVLRGGSSIVVLPGFLSLTYLENRGAAFGIFEGKQYFLIGLTALILAAVGFCLFTNRVQGRGERFSLTLILAGGVGNLVDRVLRGFVVDYLDINPWFSYPIFNLADCFVVVGAILMVLLVFREEIRGKKHG